MLLYTSTRGTYDAVICAQFGSTPEVLLSYHHTLYHIKSIHITRRQYEHYLKPA